MYDHIFHPLNTISLNFWLEHKCDHLYGGVLLCLVYVLAP